MRNPTPESVVVVDFLLREVDALPWETDPDQRGREAEDGADAVEVVDGDAPSVYVKVALPRLGQRQDAPSHARMQQPHAHAGNKALAPGLDASHVLCDLQHVLEGLEQAVLGGFGVEAAGAGEGLYDAPASHAADEGLEGEGDDGGPAVAVEDGLPAGDLRPVDPGRDGVELRPEGGEGGIGGVVGR